MAPVDSGDSKESTPLMSETPTPLSNRALLPNGKKTKGRVKIKMEYIGNKLRRYTTFSKRKTGIMKKAHELSTLTGTQVMLIVASETGHVYAFATNKLKPLISGEPGKSLIQGCLNAPDDPANDSNAVKTEFTFEPPNGGNPNSVQNGRKRKLDTNEELMSLPTMVSSSPPLNEYCDSDNESEEESDSRMDEDDEKPPVLQQANVDFFTKIVQEALRNSNEQRQKQAKPQKRKSQQAVSPSQQSTKATNGLLQLFK
ncbi:Serum response factor [Aphelenchoides bicaudatus]|nr:Serum response factor [Aphelenchoides bicaudatus]